jgi:hypothetical protein
MKMLDLTRATLLGLCLLSALGACGSSSQSADAAKPDAAKEGGTASTSGVWEWQRVDLLSASEKKTLCDWENAARGGYGQKTSCAGGQVDNDADQEACVARHDFVGAQCGVIAADVEACASMLRENICVYLIWRVCEVFRTCRSDAGGGS